MEISLNHRLFLLVTTCGTALKTHGKFQLLTTTKYTIDCLCFKWVNVSWIILSPWFFVLFCFKFNWGIVFENILPFFTVSSFRLMETITCYFLRRVSSPCGTLSLLLVFLRFCAAPLPFPFSIFPNSFTKMHQGTKAPEKLWFALLCGTLAPLTAGGPWVLPGESRQGCPYCMEGRDCRRASFLGISGHTYPLLTRACVSTDEPLHDLSLWQLHSDPPRQVPLAVPVPFGCHPAADSAGFSFRFTSCMQYS